MEYLFDGDKASLKKNKSRIVYRNSVHFCSISIDILGDMLEFS